MEVASFVTLTNSTIQRHPGYVSIIMQPSSQTLKQIPSVNAVPAGDRNEKTLLALQMHLFSLQCRLPAQHVTGSKLHRVVTISIKSISFGFVKLRCPSTGSMEWSICCMAGRVPVSVAQSPSGSQLIGEPISFRRRVNKRRCASLDTNRANANVSMQRSSHRKNFQPTFCWIRTSSDVVSQRVKFESCKDMGKVSCLT